MEIDSISADFGQNIWFHIEIVAKAINIHNTIYINKIKFTIV